MWIFNRHLELNMSERKHLVPIPPPPLLCTFHIFSLPSPANGTTIHLFVQDKSLGIFLAPLLSHPISNCLANPAGSPFELHPEHDHFLLLKTLPTLAKPPSCFSLQTVPLLLFYLPTPTAFFYTATRAILLKYRLSLQKLPVAFHTIQNKIHSPHCGLPGCAPSCPRLLPACCCGHSRAHPTPGSSGWPCARVLLFQTPQCWSLTPLMSDRRASFTSPPDTGPPPIGPLHWQYSPLNIDYMRTASLHWILTACPMPRTGLGIQYWAINKYCWTKEWINQRLYYDLPSLSHCGLCLTIQ